MNLSALFDLLPDEIAIIEAGGWPMRVTPEQHKRITALAANFDENHTRYSEVGIRFDSGFYSSVGFHERKPTPRPLEEGCWVRTCSLGNRHQGPCQGGNL